jgi:hypothetical protein
MSTSADPYAEAEAAVVAAKKRYDESARELEAAARERTLVAIRLREARAAAAVEPSRATQNADGKGR